VDLELIIEEVSSQLNGDIVDFNNQSHLYELSKILNEKYDSDTATEVFSRIAESVQILTEKPRDKRYPAFIKDTGRKVYFGSKEGRENALRAGTHKSSKSTPVEIPDKKKKKKESPDGGGKKSKKKSSGGVGGLAAKLAGSAKKANDSAEKEQEEKEKKIASAPAKKVKVAPKLFGVYETQIDKFLKSWPDFSSLKLRDIDPAFWGSVDETSDDEFKMLFNNTEYKTLDFPSDIEIPKSASIRYAKLLKRFFMVERVSDYKLSTSVFYSGVWEQNSNVVALFTLVVVFLKEKSNTVREEFRNALDSYIKSKADIKFIIDSQMVSTAYRISESLHAKYSLMYKKYEVSQVALSAEDDVKAIGLHIEDYQKIDIFVRLNVDGKSIVRGEIIRKSDSDYLFKIHGNISSILAIPSLGKKYDDEYKKSVMLYRSTDISIATRKQAYDTMKSIESKVENKSGVSNRDMYELQVEFYGQMSKECERYVAMDSEKRVAPKVNDAVMKRAFVGRKNDVEKCGKVLASLAHGKLGSSENVSHLKKIFNLSDHFSTLSAAILLAKYYEASGNGNISDMLKEYEKQRGNHSRVNLFSFAKNEDMRNSLLRLILDKFPIKSILSGDVGVSFGSLPLFSTVFSDILNKQDSDIKWVIALRRDVWNSYQIVLSASNGVEMIPILIVELKYLSAYSDSLVMLGRMHGEFIKRLAQSCGEIGIRTNAVERILKNK
jgi:hypothetical protein